MEILDFSSLNNSPGSELVRITSSTVKYVGCMRVEIVDDIIFGLALTFVCFK